MSTSTVALTIEIPSLDASLSWNALESLVVGMSHEVPARALALALDDAQERLLQEACGPRWAPVRGRLAPFACPGCGAREDFARKGKRTRPRKLHTAAGTVELILWHVGCRGCGRNFAPLLVILGMSGKRRTDQPGPGRAGHADVVRPGGPRGRRAGRDLRNGGAGPQRHGRRGRAADRWPRARARRRPARRRRAPRARRARRRPARGRPARRRRRRRRRARRRPARW